MRYAIYPYFLSITLGCRFASESILLMCRWQVQERMVNLMVLGQQQLLGDVVKTFLKDVVFFSQYSDCFSYCWK
eukprot:c28955_g3_i1 orf=2-220(-)